MSVGLYTILKHLPLDEQVRVLGEVALVFPGQQYHVVLQEFGAPTNDAPPSEATLHMRLGQTVHRLTEAMGMREKHPKLARKSLAVAVQEFAELVQYFEALTPLPTPPEDTP